MEERRTQHRRKGPIRLAQRRKSNDLSKARLQRGPERRTADRRSGIERRVESMSGELRAAS